jgi:hypothetical protein
MIWPVRSQPFVQCTYMTMGRSGDGVISTWRTYRTLDGMRSIAHTPSGFSSLANQARWTSG